MDKATRIAIERATQQARKLLEEDFSSQLEGTFDVLRSGVIASRGGAHLSALQQSQRYKMVAAIEHKCAVGMNTMDAVTDYLRDTAFTTLNRFVALKMLEARELVQECITKGEQSAGYREFCGMAPGVALLPDAAGYRLYIESLFDEFSTEIKVLFDRSDVASVLWPKRQSFEALLVILNAQELSAIWAEDETIGWVYQFFNSGEERKKMREQSQAPRNSRELAVRNQFFTPRYVVQFLTDNTLGRIWYEMQNGSTLLTEVCKYLVWHPNDRFESRAKKDPRELRILDPACGSGHFLLYAFDLLIIIYEEAWADLDAPESQATGRRLRDDYPELVALREAIPGLVLRNNLYGVDIDPRCAQIAQLALWMRAQRAFQVFGVQQRPSIAKTNIVIAEPMSGDLQLSKEFIGSLDDNLTRLMSRVFDTMLLAGEAGSLLRIEHEIRSAIREIHGEHGRLFQQSDEERWQESEKQLLSGLEEYAERAQNGRAYRRRLFAEDAARGFDFVDLCRQRYDVVLMNPPFGEFIDARFSYLDAEYPLSKRDLAIAFVDRAFEMAGTSGFVGAVHSRKTLFLDTQQAWRESVARRWSLSPLADLGHRVLDNALVEVAATVFRPIDGPSMFIDCLDAADKETALLDAIGTGMKGRRVRLWELSEFSILPSGQFAYKAPKELLNIFRRFPALDPMVAFCRDGLSTRDNYRFLRLHWELPPSYLRNGWARVAKGGEYSPYYLDAELLVRWDDGRGALAAHGAALGNEARSRQGSTYYFRPSLTYTERTASRMSVRVLPVDTIFTTSGPGVVLADPGNAASLLGLLNSHVFSALHELCIGGGDSVSSGAAARHYTPGGLGRMPVPSCEVMRDAGSWPSLRLAELQMATARQTELSPVFSGYATDPSASTSLTDCAEKAFVVREDRLMEMWDLSAIVEDYTLRAYDLDRDYLSELESIVGPHVSFYPHNQDVDPEVFQRIFELEENELVNEVASKVGNARYVVVKSYVADRRFELLAHYFRTHPKTLVRLRRESRLLPSAYVTEVAKTLVSQTFGRVFGRWKTSPAREWHPEDLLATGYPVRPPALLEERALSAPSILVDDSGHRSDLLSAIAEVLQRPLTETQLFVQAIHHLHGGEVDIRRWLSTQWFDLHLNHYSVHRRKAPIYWQLATPTSSYSLWLYYDSSTSDTLYKIQNDYVLPKLAHEERKLEAMRLEAGSSLTRRQLETQEALVEELRAFLDEVRRVSTLWNPSFEDGVIINFAPLWRLVAHKTWRSELKATWDALTRGEFDWTHLAMRLWPDRVVPKCATDRSLAIAHGLEEIFWAEGDDGKWVPRPAPTCPVEDLVRERASIAVKAALKNLLEAPTANANGGRARVRRVANAVADRGAR